VRAEGAPVEGPQGTANRAVEKETPLV
jgi:hypothetical protein